MADKKRITRRTAERLIRAAYEYEYLATKMRAEGWEGAAGDLTAAARLMGDAGRSLAEKMGA